jgi:hypothetical protein
VRGIAALACALLLPAAALAVDETALFHQSALDQLIAKGLGKTEPGTFVCLGIDHKSPDAAQLARVRQRHMREIGTLEDCKCVDAEPASVCTRSGTSQPACMLSVYAFEFRALTNARATMTVVCGWPKGYGETARFEKRDDDWQYIGAVSLIKF